MEELLEGTLNFYTDGACSGNPGPGGYGIVCLEGKNILYSCNKQCENTTNNRMELEAILRVIKDFPHILSYGFNIVIHSDSAYCVNMLNDWIWKWVKYGWTRAGGKPIENLDLVKEIYAFILRRRQLPGKITFIKIPGHSGIIGNELADALATNNIDKYKSLIKKNALCDDIILYNDTSMREA